MKRYSIMFLLFFVLGCATISPFDQYSYAQSTSVKVDVLNLMGKSNEQYSDHITDIENINSKLMKNIEYEKHRPKNSISIAMYNILWKLINDTTSIKFAGTEFKHGFFPEWEKRKSFSSDTSFINQAKIQIGEGFDLIAELESKKIKDSDGGISNFLSKNK